MVVQQIRERDQFEKEEKEGMAGMEGVASEVGSVGTGDEDVFSYVGAVGTVAFCLLVFRCFRSGVMALGLEDSWPTCGTWLFKLRGLVSLSFVDGLEAIIWVAKASS